jgi:hypothetical protein
VNIIFRSDIKEASGNIICPEDALIENPVTPMPGMGMAYRTFSLECDISTINIWQKVYSLPSAAGTKPLFKPQT